MARMPSRAGWKGPTVGEVTVGLNVVVSWLEGTGTSVQYK